MTNGKMMDEFAKIAVDAALAVTPAAVPQGGLPKPPAA